MYEHVKWPELVLSRGAAYSNKDVQLAPVRQDDCKRTPPAAAKNANEALTACTRKQSRCLNKTTNKFLPRSPMGIPTYLKTISLPVLRRWWLRLTSQWQTG
jgi:hypothetical protein